MPLDRVIEKLRALPDYAGQIVHIERLPAHEASYQQLARGLPRELVTKLHRQGVHRLYSHQAQAIDASREGYHVIVTTGTASGKTLCYNIPVLDAILRDSMARALYLFPTKALAQDQARALSELVAHSRLADMTVGVYDGDTPKSARGRLRRRASIILSNPDMLSLGILPNHAGWATFFRHLKYVVLDEAHVYRGIFGSHVALLMRRLRRITAHYGATPRFMLCSATIANAEEHASRLIGQPVELVDGDGAPCGPRRFLLWNPPLTDPNYGDRRSINSEATDIFATLVREGVRNITFVQSRRVAELIYRYTYEVLRNEDPELAERISPYRGGYLAADRRDIEQRLFTGELLGVTATNALELGIDVGDLEATVLVGYPGTIASTWQQAGRAGRGSDEALTVMLAHNNPLDQYFVRHPKDLFSRPHEHALIDPENLYLLRAHLLCSAFEVPISGADSELFGRAIESIVGELEGEGYLEQRGERWFCTGIDYPAQYVNLRTASSHDYLLIDSGSGQLLESIDAATAFFRIHPGAVHLHQGQTYLVTDLDLDRRVAMARMADLSYYTQPIEENQVRIIRSTRSRQVLQTTVFCGQVRVTVQMLGYRRKDQYGRSSLGEEQLDLPPFSFVTQALWYQIPKEIRRAAQAEGIDMSGGLHAIEHASIGMLPFFAMCDRNDIGGLSTPAHTDTGHPQIFIYDAMAGGVGIAEKGFDLIEELWERTLETVEGCPCQYGCPSCIQSPKCGNNNEPLSKSSAVFLLRQLLDRHGS